MFVLVCRTQNTSGSCKGHAAKPAKPVLGVLGLGSHEAASPGPGPGPEEKAFTESTALRSQQMLKKQALTQKMNL